MAEMELCSRAKIVPPDINRSGAEFFTDYATDEIYWSLVRIKMLGGKAAQYIIAERDAGGEYTSLEDFMRRIFRKKIRGRSGANVCGQEDEGRMPVTTRHLKNMILSGCFDGVEEIGSVTERYGLLRAACDLTGMELKEEEFCELYVRGGPNYAGKHSKCYAAAYKTGEGGGMQGAGKAGAGQTSC